MPYAPTFALYTAQFMEVVKEEYVEDIPLQHLQPAQYLAFARQAVARLQWFTVALSDNTIVCQTQINGYSQGEIISVTVQQKKATLHSRPVNEYYWDEGQNKKSVLLLRQVIDEIIGEADKADRNLHPMHREKYGALVPSRSYIVTPLIVYTNALIFIAMVLAGVSPLQPTAQSLFLWGGNLRLAVTGGETWRLLTYMFLHAGAMHLLMNTFALLYIGMFLEPLMGRLRFISSYILTGVCAGLLSIAVHTSSVGVGASGAIFGLYGVFLSVLTTSHIQKTVRKTMLRSILFFIVFNLVSGLQGNTDNAAHIGGLLSGLLIGYIYYPGISNHTSAGRQLLTTAIVATLISVLATLALHYL